MLSDVLREFISPSRNTPPHVVDILVQFVLATCKVPFLSEDQALRIWSSITAHGNHVKPSHLKNFRGYCEARRTLFRKKLHWLLQTGVLTREERVVIPIRDTSGNESLVLRTLPTFHNPIPPTFSTEKINLDYLFATKTHLVSRISPWPPTQHRHLTGLGHEHEITEPSPDDWSRYSQSNIVRIPTFQVSPTTRRLVSTHQRTSHETRYERVVANDRGALHETSIDGLIRTAPGVGETAATIADSTSNYWIAEVFTQCVTPSYANVIESYIPASVLDHDNDSLNEDRFSCPRLWPDGYFLSRHSDAIAFAFVGNPQRNCPRYHQAISDLLMFCQRNELIVFLH